MLYLLIFGVLFAGLGYMVYKRSKADEVMYSKVAAIMLFFISLFYTYQYVYYQQIGLDYARYGAFGGVSIYNNATNTTQTFFNANDTRVQEYMALQKSGADIMPIMSNLLPIFAIALAGWLIWYYVETGLFGQKGTRMT